MGEFRSIQEILGEQRFDVLGGKSMAECITIWEDRWSRGLGINWPWGPKAQQKRAAAAVKPAPIEGLDRHLQCCGVPDRARAAVVAGLAPRPVVLAVAEWAKSEASFLLIHGDPNQGKTCAAASALLAAKRVTLWDGGGEEYWDSGRCAFMRAEDLAPLSHFDPDALKMLRFLADAHWLVLDDLGAELVAAPWLATLDALIDSRYQRAGRRTVLTTNLSAARPAAGVVSPFEERYGARVARRIRESGKVVGA